MRALRYRLRLPFEPYTDYYVTIYTKAQSPGDPKLPPQELMFSTYGPNNQDHAIQGTYRRAPDDMYIQATPQGEVIAFRAKTELADSQLLWASLFKNNVYVLCLLSSLSMLTFSSVVVFDVLQSPSRQNPMVLLQPQPRLQDLLPSFDFSSSQHSSEHDFSSTYIGIIDENKSLYALSPEHYPLALFADKNYLFARPSGRVPTIDAPPGEGDSGLLDLPADIDSVSRLIRERERCSGNKWDRACIIGSRPVAASEQSRLSRLLPDKAHEEESAPELQYGSGDASGDTNYSQAPAIDAKPQLPTIEGGQKQFDLSSGAAALAIFLIGLWYFTKKTSFATTTSNQRKSAEEESMPVSLSTRISPLNGNSVLDKSVPKSLDFALQNTTSTLDGQNGHASSSTDKLSDDAPAQPVGPDAKDVQPEAPSVPAAVEEVEGDDDSDREGENSALQGKKKGPRRRKRGKKHKGTNVIADTDQIPVETPPVEGVNGDVEVLPPITPLATSTISTSSSTPAISTPQLVMSEEILGAYKAHFKLVDP